MSHNYSQHYHFMISPSLGIEWDPVRASGVTWRRAVAEAVWDALEQGRMSFYDQGPFIYHSRELHRRNLVEHWRISPSVDNHFLSPREELLPDRGTIQAKGKRDSNNQY